MPRYCARAKGTEMGCLDFSVVETDLTRAIIAAIGSIGDEYLEVASPDDEPNRWISILIKSDDNPSDSTTLVFDPPVEL